MITGDYCVCLRRTLMQNGRRLLIAGLTMLWSIDSCHNRVSTDQYHLTVSPAQVSTQWGQVFFEFIRWQVTNFQMIAGSSLFFFFNSYESAAQLKCWFQTDLVRENSASYYRQGCFWLCSPRSRVGHARRPIFMLWLVEIRQVSSCGKFMQHLESCWILLSAEAERVLCQVVMFLTVFFDWMYKMKFSCYQESSVIHG